MPDFLLEQLSYSLSHILSTTLYIPRNILGIIYSQDIFIAVESEKLASECNFPRAFRKKSTHRAKSSYPRCQHSCSEIISATKPPKRRNMPGNMRDETVTTAGISSYSGLERWDSSPGPSIFRGIFRNTKFWRTLYIPKEIPEYLAKANTHAEAHRLQGVH